MRQPYNYYHHHPPRYYYHYYPSSFTWFWWIFLLFAFGFVSIYLILAITSPVNITKFYHEIPLAETIRKSKSNCDGATEKFDDDLGICAPIINTPVPILKSMMNTNVGICHSFYRHMCGKWIATHTNENRAFSYIYRKNMKQVHDIIKDPASGPIYNFYRSCLDTLVLKLHAYETGQQIRHVSEQILGGLQTHADLPVIFARLSKYGFNAPFSMSIESHPTKSQLIPLFRFDTVPGFSNKLTKQLNTWHSNPEENADIDFINYVQSGKFQHDVISMKEFNEMVPVNNFWKEYLAELNGVSALEIDLMTDMKSEQVWVLDKTYFRKLFQTLNSFSIQEWREFVQASIDYNTKDFLPLLPPNAYFRKHDISPIGNDPVWIEHRLAKNNNQDNNNIITEEQCLAVTHKLLPGLIAQEFLHRNMPQSEVIRARVTQIVKNIRDAYAQLVQETPWLSPETKQQAVDKIHSMIVRAVHPNTWETEPFADRLTRDRYLRNLNMIRRYRVQRNYELWIRSSKQKNKVNRDVVQRFGAPLTTVNAFYSPVTNTITIFAGIIQEPFFSLDYSDVAIYAGLGMIVGHELSHGLDPTGRQFDGEGSIRKWWTDNDIENFTTRANCIVNEYGPPAGCDNAQYGAQTLGEDVADITGISIAWKAFITANPKASLEQRKQFFEIFAQLWAESFDQDHLCNRVNNDVHAIAEFRVDKTLRQLPQFQETFGCKVRDLMVNNNKCHIYG